MSLTSGNGELILSLCIFLTDPQIHISYQVVGPNSHASVDWAWKWLFGEAETTVQCALGGQQLFAEKTKA